jgi:uncharacterized membrane protein YeaQ/YmgE (transglycosylase-associated protein family)
MNDHNASIAARWSRSPTAQGVALGCVLGPVGALLAFLFSSMDKRSQRTFAALKGSLAASIAMLVVGGCVVVVLSVF